MANYDSAGTIEIVGDMLAAGTISAAVAAAINAAMENGGSANVVTPSADGAPVNVSSVDATTIIAQDTAITGNFGANSQVDTIAVAQGVGNNNINFASSNTNNVQVFLGGGTNDQVQTAAGEDTVEFNGGSATIGTGAGNDEIVIGVDNGSASIDGGTGFDRVTFHGGKGGHTFGFDGTHFTMHSANIQMDNINVVTFDPDNNGVIDTATVLASTAGESLIAKLYQIGLGREMLDQDHAIQGQAEITGATKADYQLAGFTWWTQTAGANDANANLLDLAKLFVGTTEFQAKIGSQDAAGAVATMFANLGTPDSVAGKTQADFVNDLNNGSTLADVALALAMSQETVQILGQNGENYVIDGGDFTLPTA